MARSIAEHEMTTVAGYRLLTLRDQDNDAGVGSSAAIDRLKTSIVAGTGYELFISCVQDLFPVTARVVVWDGEPEAEPGGMPRLPLECPTGLLVLGSPTGEVTDFTLPPGPGEYHVAVSHAGRDEAERVRRTVLERLGSDPDALDELDRYAGLERYAIDLWYAGPVDDEDDVE
ncbi:hypothetical protein [Amycolatopsis sp. NPDC051371]|uniref:hypothetical protein n=1 Tax=Amycolatopsis sp. NPDC051371 TaxID=3155800 RepID=UPI003434B684